MNSKVISVLSLIFCSVFGKEVLECNDENKTKMDRLLMEMSTLGDPNGKYPTNLEELSQACSNEREKLKWCVSYNEKCVSGVSQELMTIALKDLDKILKKYCDSPRLSKLYISWSECGNKALNSTVKCWQEYVIDLERVNVEKERIPNSDKMPIICCTYHKFDQCVEDALISKGSDICPQSVTEGLHSVLNEIMGRAIDLFCGDYQSDSDKCDPIREKYSHLNKITFERLINKSPLNPFIDIVSGTGIELKEKTDN